MYSKTVSTEHLEQLLARLGYKVTTSNSQYRVFEYLEFDAHQFFPPAGKEKMAREEHLMTLRKIATWKGIVGEDEFDRVLREILAHDESVAA